MARALELINKYVFVAQLIFLSRRFSAVLAGIYTYMQFYHLPSAI